MKKPESMKHDMPITSAFLREMIEVFGRDQVRPSIDAGLDGQPAFYAKENGFEVGCRRDTRNMGELNARQFIALGQVGKQAEKGGKR